MSFVSPHRNLGKCYASVLYRPNTLVSIYIPTPQLDYQPFAKSSNFSLSWGVGEDIGKIRLEFRDNGDSLAEHDGGFLVIRDIPPMHLVDEYVASDSCLVTSEPDHLIIHTPPKLWCLFPA